MCVPNSPPFYYYGHMRFNVSSFSDINISPYLVFFFCVAMTTRVVSLICGQWCVKTAVLIWLATSQLNNPSLKNKILLFKERKKDETWVSSSLKSVTSSKKKRQTKLVSVCRFFQGVSAAGGG